MIRAHCHSTAAMADPVADQPDCELSDILANDEDLNFTVNTKHLQPGETLPVVAPSSDIGRAQDYPASGVTATCRKQWMCKWTCTCNPHHCGKLQYQYDHEMSSVAHCQRATFDTHFRTPPNSHTFKTGERDASSSPQLVLSDEKTSTTGLTGATPAGPFGRHWLITWLNHYSRYG